MDRQERARSLFRAIDAKDVGAFSAFLTEDVTFRFGNAPPVSGRDAVAGAVGAFFGGIAGLRHDVAGVWDTGDALVCDGTVTYTRHDGSALTVPFAVVLRLSGDAIADYAIYVDASTLF